MAKSKGQRKFDNRQETSEAPEDELRDLLKTTEETTTNINKEVEHIKDIPKNIKDAADDTENIALDNINKNAEIISTEAKEEIKEYGRSLNKETDETKNFEASKVISKKRLGSEQNKSEKEYGRSPKKVTGDVLHFEKSLAKDSSRVKIKEKISEALDSEIESMDEEKARVLIEKANSLEELKDIIIKNKINFITARFKLSTELIIESIDNFKLGEGIGPRPAGLRRKICELTLKEDPDNFLAKHVLQALDSGKPVTELKEATKKTSIEELDLEQNENIATSKIETKEETKEEFVEYGRNPKKVTHENQHFEAGNQHFEKKITKDNSRIKSKNQTEETPKEEIKEEPAAIADAIKFMMDDVPEEQLNGSKKQTTETSKEEAVENIEIPDEIIQKVYSGDTNKNANSKEKEKNIFEKSKEKILNFKFKNKNINSIDTSTKNKISEIEETTIIEDESITSPEVGLMDEEKARVLIEKANSLEELKDIIVKNNITVKGRSSDIIWCSSDIIDMIDKFKQEVAPPRDGGIRIKVCELILKEDSNNAFAKKLLTEEGIKIEDKDNPIEEVISNTETKQEEASQEKTKEEFVENIEKVENKKFNEFFEKLSWEDLQDIDALREKFDNEVMSDEVLNEMGLGERWKASIREKYFDNFSLQAEAVMQEHIAAAKTEDSLLKKEGKKFGKSAVGAAAFVVLRQGAMTLLRVGTSPGLLLKAGVGGLVGGTIAGFKYMIGKDFKKSNAKSIKKLAKQAEKMEGKGLAKKAIFEQLKGDMSSLLHFDQQQEGMMEQQRSIVYSLKPEEINKYFSGEDTEDEKAIDQKHAKMEGIQRLYALTYFAKEGEGTEKQENIEERQELIKELTANNALEEYITFQIDKKLGKLEDVQNLSGPEKNRLIIQAELMVSREMNVILGDVVAQEKFDEIDKNVKSSYERSYVAKLFGKTPPESLMQSITKGFVSGAIAGGIYTDATAGAAYMLQQRLRGSLRSELLGKSTSEVKTTKDILEQFSGFKLNKDTFNEAKDLINESRARIKLPDIKESERAKIELKIESLQKRMIMEVSINEEEEAYDIKINELSKTILAERKGQIDLAIDIAKKEKERKSWKGLVKTFGSLSGKERLIVLANAGLEGVKGALYGAIGIEAVDAGTALALGEDYDVEEGVRRVIKMGTLNVETLADGIGEKLEDVKEAYDNAGILGASAGIAIEQLGNAETFEELKDVYDDLIGADKYEILGEQTPGIITPERMFPEDRPGFKAMFPETSQETEGPSWKWANDQDRSGVSPASQAEGGPNFEEALIGTPGDKQFVDEVGKSFESGEETLVNEDGSSNVKKDTPEYKEAMDKMSALLEAKNQARAQIEKDFEINSFDGITPEELNNIKEQVDGPKSEEAKALLEQLNNEGKISDQQKFSTEHTYLEHAGFKQIETSSEENIISLDLGKDGAPNHLEQVLYYIAIDNMSLGEEGVTNVEAAQILNTAANIRVLLEGHDVAGSEAAELQKYISIEGDKVIITDYEGLQNHIVSNLVIHAENTITAENLTDKGATAYINEIKGTTWGHMLEPKGITEEQINLDPEQIKVAEENLFQGTLSKSGLGELATNINFEDQDTGTFVIDSQEIEVKDNQVIRVSGTVLNESISLDGKESGDKLIDMVSKVKADEFLILVGQNQENTNTEAESLLPAIPEYDVKIALETTLNKLGFDSDHGKAQWDFIKHKPLDDLLNQEIKGYSKANAEGADNFLELHNRSVVRSFIQDAINNGDLVAPKDGGPTTVEDGMKELMESQTREKLSHDIDLAEKKVSLISEISSDEMREGKESISDIKSATAVELLKAWTNDIDPDRPDYQKTAMELADNILSERADLFEKYNVNNEGTDQERLERITEVIKEAIARGESIDQFPDRPEEPIVETQKAENNEGKSEKVEKTTSNEVVEDLKKNIENYVVDETEEDLVTESYQSSVAEEHFKLATGDLLTTERIANLNNEGLIKLQSEVKTQIDGLLEGRPLLVEKDQINIDSVVAGYEAKLDVIKENLEELEK